MKYLWILLFFVSFSAVSADRIVSTSPAITEIVYHLGAGKNIVGISNYCKTPGDNRIIPRVGTSLDLDFESLVRLKPELVILSSSSKLMLKKKLVKLKLKTLWVKHEGLTDILESIKVISKHLNKEKKGNELITEINKSLLNENTTQKRILIAVGASLSGSGLKSVYVAGKGSFYNDILNKMNLKNAAPLNKNQYPVLDMEQIIKSRPDQVILVFPTSEKDSSVKRSLKAWRSIKFFKGNVNAIVDDYAILPGPRISLLAKKIKELAFAGSN